MPYANFSGGTPANATALVLEFTVADQTAGGGRPLGFNPGLTNTRPLGGCGTQPSSIGRRPARRKAGSRMAQAHLTNQVIPREMLEQWEREADASTSAPWSACPCSLLLRGRCGPKSWSEYVVAKHNSSESFCSCDRYHAILTCIAMPCCTPVYLLHLPFCCCPFLYRKWKELEWQDQEDSSCISSVFSLLRCCRCPVSHSLVRLASKCDWALKSCDAAFEQTLLCGWCCSYCLGNFSCDQVQVSYHDWLHKEDERRHREAYVAERAAEYAERRGT